MKKYTSPKAEALTLGTSDVIAVSGEATGFTINNTQADFGSTTYSIGSEFWS